jgi:hypothetical protein
VLSATGPNHRFAARCARLHRLVARRRADDAHDDSIKRLHGDALRCADLTNSQGHCACVFHIEGLLILHVCVACVLDIPSVRRWECDMIEHRRSEKVAGSAARARQCASTWEHIRSAGWFAWLKNSEREVHRSAPALAASPPTLAGSITSE